MRSHLVRIPMMFKDPHKTTKSKRMALALTFPRMPEFHHLVLLA